MLAAAQFSNQARQASALLRLFVMAKSAPLASPDESLAVDGIDGGKWGIAGACWAGMTTLGEGKLAKTTPGCEPRLTTSAEVSSFDYLFTSPSLHL